MKELEVKLMCEIDQIMRLRQDQDKEVSSLIFMITEEIKRREYRLYKIGKAKKLSKSEAKKPKMQKNSNLTINQKGIKKRNVLGVKERAKQTKEPSLEPRVKDQYNFTDPELHIMASINVTMHR
tara:strand:+ start:761 stop:1132 length:372 start_codon:yes stop_codon:yes gene_type:complete